VPLAVHSKCRSRAGPASSIWQHVRVSDARAWSIFETLWDTDRSGLSRDQRLLVALAGLRQEVNSGGFDRYFRYTYGADAQSAVEAANEVSCPALGALILEGIARLDLDLDHYPAEAATREDWIDALDLEFDDLDASFYALENQDDLDARMETLAARIP
jgi:hypothetical protein